MEAYLKKCMDMEQRMQDTWSPLEEKNNQIQEVEFEDLPCWLM